MKVSCVMSPCLAAALDSRYCLCMREERQRPETATAFTLEEAAFLRSAAVLVASPSGGPGLLFVFWLVNCVSCVFVSLFGVCVSLFGVCVCMCVWSRPAAAAAGRAYYQQQQLTGGGLIHLPRAFSQTTAQTTTAAHRRGIHLPRTFLTNNSSNNDSSSPEGDPLALDDELALARILVEDGEERLQVQVQVAQGLVRPDVVLFVRGWCVCLFV